MLTDMAETKNSNPSCSASLSPTERDNDLISEKSKRTASFDHRADEQDFPKAERVNREVRFVATESDIGSGVQAGDGDICELG